MLKMSKQSNLFVVYISLLTKFDKNYKIIKYYLIKLKLLQGVVDHLLEYFETGYTPKWGRKVFQYNNSSKNNLL